MVDFRNREESDLLQTVHHTRGRRGRLGRRRRQTVLPLERLEDRTLLSFNPIAQPGDTIPPSATVYTAGTSLIPITTADGGTFSSVTDGMETVTFDQTMTAATSPASGWFTQWGTTPAVEADNTKLAFETAASSLTLTLSQPASVFGVEMAPDQFASVPMTATFFENGVQVGTPIAQTVDYTAGAGALLFAASTNQAFTSVVLSAPGGVPGIAVAQVRYALATTTLSLTKTASEPQVLAGQDVTFSIGLTNTGNSDALGTTVTDPLPADTNFQGVGTLPPGWTETDPGVGNGGTVTFTDSNPFAAGDSANFTIIAQVNTGCARLYARDQHGHRQLPQFQLPLRVRLIHGRRPDREPVWEHVRHRAGLG